jgi:hypothetical protein
MDQNGHIVSAVEEIFDFDERILIDQKRVQFSRALY